MCLVSALVCRILSESVGNFFGVISSICIAFISILCYYQFTDSVCPPWQFRYFFFRIRVMLPRERNSWKARTNYDRKQ